jgi:hypothetical protein
MNRVVYRHPSSGYEDQQQNTRTTPRTLPQPRGSRLLLRVAMQLSLAQRPGADVYARWRTLRVDAAPASPAILNH